MTDRQIQIIKSQLAMAGDEELEMMEDSDDSSDSENSKDDDEVYFELC